MTVVSISYRRHLGMVYSMEPGDWTSETMSGDVAICCRSCAGIYDIDPTTHRIERDGFVVPAVQCPHGPCSEFSYIRLANFPDLVLT